MTKNQKKENEDKKILDITISSSMKDTLKEYCKEAGLSLEEVYKIKGQLIGTKSIEKREEMINSLISTAFFAGIFLAKEKKDLIKNYSREELNLEKLFGEEKSSYFG